LLTKRGEGGVDHSFDDLAMGLDTGAITRGKAMKLGGAALVASALSIFGAGRAEAGEVTTEGKARRRCNQKGGDFCKHKGKCKICCGEGRRRRKAC
jgi:hypothetical protein